jgi:hypothetical protein
MPGSLLELYIASGSDDMAGSQLLLLVVRPSA